MLYNTDSETRSGPQAQTLAGKVVIITGGTSGIGQAAALALAKEAYGIVIFSRRADAPALLSPFTAYPNVLAVAGDVTSPRDMLSLTEQTLMRFQRIDALVHCAGVFPRGSFLDIPHDQWQSAIDTNLTGYALACRSVLPHMIAQGSGRIVNISSRLAAAPVIRTTAYSASKAGAALLTKSLALDLAQQGHRDIVLSDLIPGPTLTAMNPNGQPPAAVVPFLRQLLLLPPGSPSGKTYFHGQPYDLFGQK